MDIEALRELFPLCKNYVFLNNAAESPLNNRVNARLQEYLHLCAVAPHLKPEHVRIEVKKRLAELLGGNSRDYALVSNTGMGVGIVAAGYPWQKGDNVVLPAEEHWSNTFPWLNLEKQGVEVRFVPTDQNNRITAENVSAKVDHKTKIIAAAAVRFNSGYRSDLKALSQIAHQAGAIFLVDGIQGVGAIPLNVETDGIDILSAAGFKWLLGLPGTGFLYIKKELQEMIHPLLPGMFAAENSFTQLNYHSDARRYEGGSTAYSLFHAWTAGLDLLQEIGIENIHQRVLKLTDLLIAGLKEQGFNLLTPVETTKERSAIIVFSAPLGQDNMALYQKLLAQNIIITYRGDSLRVSPSFYNTEEEIEIFLKALKS